MPKLIIDTVEIEVPEGTNVLEAARGLGITIPHFCWHPALGRAGSCRACAVKILEGPAKGIQMSCMLPAQDGMVVSTTDAEAVALRRTVIEWLMINHPHDCPVCDEGGECQLQDFTIAGGHGIRRYDGLKRTHVNQYLGEYIEHEMNRCIQCYRCVRFYQEYAGGTDFGVMGRAGMVYFGRQQEGPLESPFSGNLADICPTGVFTDKTARFRARYWDYDMAPSLCPHCSLGCNTVPRARYRELLKITARRNDDVNGWFICDRGRFSHSTVNAPDRPRQVRAEGRCVSFDDGLAALAEHLKGFLTLHGPAALAVLGSPRMSQEGNIMAARLSRFLNAGALCYFDTPSHAEQAAAALTLKTDGRTASQNDVRNADLVAVLDCGLSEKAPMMDLATRQAWRSGARVYIVGGGSRPGSAGELFECTSVSTLSDVPLGEAERPVIICAAGCAESDIVSAGLPKTVKVACILDGPDTFGCAALSRDHGAVAFSTAVARGTIKGIISFEADFPEELPEGVAVIGAADWQNSRLLARAEVAIPTTAWVEQDGTFINYEGRHQSFRKLMEPGIPLKGADPAQHPPHDHGSTAPGGDAVPADRLMAALMGLMGCPDADRPPA